MRFVLKSKEEVLAKLKELNLSLRRRPKKRDNDSLYSMSRKYFGSWNKMMEEAGYKCKNYQNPEVPKDFLAEFYYFLGLVTTDGHIQYDPHRPNYNVSLYTSETEEVNLILKLIRNLFGYDSSVRKRKTFFSKRPNYQINISSKRVCEFLHTKGIPYGTKSYTIRLPSSIFCCSEENFWHYLRGVFDGNGCIIFSGYTWVFKISSGSLNFVEDIKGKFESYGICSSKIYKEKENLWELKIFTKTEISKLYKLLYKNAEYYYPRKKKKWASNMFKNEVC